LVTSYNKPLFPYDLAFTGQMGQLGQTREAAEARPVDYSRLGGAALGKRGEMYGSLYDAASRAAGARRSTEQGRELAWRKASREKEAQAERIKSENAAKAVAGVAGMGNMLAGKLGRVAGTAQGLFPGGKTAESFGRDFAELQAAGMIKQTPGKDTYHYTPKFMWQPGTVKQVETAMGPSWWGGARSTGGYGAGRRDQAPGNWDAVLSALRAAI